MDEILREATSLAQDQYGNYVVQHVLQHGGEGERKTILQTLAGQIVLLTQHKFASNVIEKCLTYCGASERQCERRRVCAPKMSSNVGERARAKMSSSKGSARERAGETVNGSARR